MSNPSPIIRPTGWHQPAENYMQLKQFCDKSWQDDLAFRLVGIPANLRREWITVEDQGQLGSCQGHALTTCVEVLYQLATGEIVQLSEIHAYLATQLEDQLLGRDVGSTIWGGVATAKAGLITESAAPYPTAYPSLAEAQRIANLPRNPRFAIRSGIAVTSAAHAKQCIAGGMALEMGILWEPPIDSDCVIRRWAPGNQGGHAIASVEIYDRRLACINSWSLRWGRQGRFFWEDSAFDAMLRDSRNVVVALSDLARPTPRRIDFKKVLLA